MRKKFLPAFRYSFRGYLRASAGFYLVAAAVIAIAAVFVILRSGGGGSSLTGYGVAAAITLFVFGIASIREDLRLLVQNSVSRRTAFLGVVLSVLAAAAVLATAGELLTWLGQLFARGHSNFYMGDLYQMIYVGIGDGAALSFSGHLISILLNTALTFGSCLCGMFFSLLFWRLKKVWKVIAGISIPFLLNVFPWIMMKIGLSPKPLIHFLAASPWNLIGFFLLISVLAAGIDWLLLRRAVIKSAK